LLVSVALRPTLFVVPVTCRNIQTCCTHTALSLQQFYRHNSTATRPKSATKLCPQKNTTLITTSASANRFSPNSFTDRFARKLSLSDSLSLCCYTTVGNRKIKKNAKISVHNSNNITCKDPKDTLQKTCKLLLVSSLVKRHNGHIMVKWTSWFTAKRCYENII